MLIRKFGASKSPTFHILNVVLHYDKPLTKESLRKYYVQSINKDLIQDQILIEKMIDSTKVSLGIINEQVDRIYCSGLGK